MPSADPLSLYPPSLPLRTRLFLAARWRLTPYERIVSRLPVHGRVLDLGCGHGLLAVTAARLRPGCTVLGIDHDAERVAIASQAARSLPNARFAVGSFADPPPGPFTAIAMIDVLHYFAPESQEALLRDAHQRLEPGGTLLMREVDPDAGAASRWNRWYEKVATGIGFTRTERGGHHFRTSRAWTALLGSCGFDVEAERCSSPLFADVLFVGRRAP